MLPEWNSRTRSSQWITSGAHEPCDRTSSHLPPNLRDTTDGPRPRNNILQYSGASLNSHRLSVAHWAFPNISFDTQKSDDENQMDMYVKTNDAHNLLRPEFIESLYYMWYFTGNKTYQNWGWQIFQVRNYLECQFEVMYRQKFWKSTFMKEGWFFYFEYLENFPLAMI